MQEFHDELGPRLEERTLARLLTLRAGCTPNKSALSGSFGSISYAELHARASRLARGLQALGVKPDDRVLVMVGNSESHVLAWLGIVFAGAVEVPVNTAFIGNMLAHVINDCEARVIVAEPDFVSRLRDVKDKTPGLRQIVVTDGESGDANLRELEVMATESLVVERDAWDLMAIMYTSGTTGPAKGVRITHAHAFTHCLSGNTGGPVENDIVLVSLPLFHIGGQWNGVYQAWIAGASVALLAKFSASSFWRDAAALGATYTTMLGAQASFLMAQPASQTDRAHRLRRLSMLPLVNDLDAFRERFGVDGVRTGYGMSEASSPIGADFNKAGRGACGWLKPGFEARIVDSHDVEVAPGVAGELTLRTRDPWILMDGYHGLPEETAKAFRNQWLHTGDLFRQDASGQFFFLDRQKDSIRRRGENISSFEVEREVCAYPAVAEAAAVGVASKHTEDELMVFVVLLEGAEFHPAELTRFLIERAPRHMVPRYVEVVVDLPRTPTNRVQKHLLRARGVGKRTWDRHGAENA